jgi:hypothetical protein
MRRIRLIGAGVMMAAFLAGVQITQDIIEPDTCPYFCKEVAAGRMSWWAALLMGCWCPDPPNQAACVVPPLRIIGHPRG